MQNIFSKITQKNTNGSINNVICNSAQKGLIPQREYFDKDIANSDNTDGYFVIKKGDFVYNPRKSVTAPYGPVSVYNYDNDGIVSPLYLCFRAREAINTSFYEWYFKSSAWHRYVYLYGDSGVRHDRVSIKDSTFFEMLLHTPCEAEQNKLSNFLTLIDTRIRKQQRLVDSLKSYKRGLSNAIFNKKIALTANVIFEYKKVKDVVRIVPDKRFQIQTLDYKSDGIFEVVDQGKENIVAYSNAKDHLFTDTPIIIFGDHTTNIKYREKSFIVGGDGVKLLKADESVLPRYIFYALNQFNVKQEGYKRHYSILKEVVLPIPSLFIQEKISTLLWEIDVLIDKHSSLLHSLTLKKAALLQKLFI